MVAEVVGYLPNIFIAGVIVFVGYILAKIVRGLQKAWSIVWVYKLKLRK
jgi:hypothetical protein